jgi:hypothetical protein
MMKQFQPSPEETYLDSAGLGRRWHCHEKTAQRRAKRFGMATLLFSNRVSYPMSEILRVEHEALKVFAGRKTEFPPQFVGTNPTRKNRRARHKQAFKAAEVPGI